MSVAKRRILLVGDNPFHGVSHLSQDRARHRGADVTDPIRAANLVRLAVENDADGFMFSATETTLAIVRELAAQGIHPRLYAIAPAASDYVRLASRLGTPGMAFHLARQIVRSGNMRAIASGVKGVVGRNPVGLMEAFLYYEIYRIRAAAGHKANPYCFMLHEIVTDMALALDLEWLFRSYVAFLRRIKIKPGFETRNAPRLIDRLGGYGIDLAQVAIVSPFNKIGFQMSPSRDACETVLDRVPDTEMIAMSVLASGYIPVPEAIEYLNGLPGLKGVVVGVSTERHARDFKRFNEASAVTA